MIKEYTTDLAKQMNIPLSKVTIDDGSTLGCLGVHLLNVYYGGKVASTLIFQSELDNFLNCIYSDRLELNVRSALERLQKLVES